MQTIKPMLTPSRRLLRRHTFINDGRRPGVGKRMETEDEGCFGPGEGIRGGDKDPRSSSSDAFEQVGVAAVSSAAVAQFPDARPELHGTAVAQTTLRHQWEISQTSSHTVLELQESSSPSSSNLKELSPASAPHTTPVFNWFVPLGGAPASLELGRIRPAAISLLSFNYQRTFAVLIKQ